MSQKPVRPIRLGLTENWPQFSLLVAINLFVGAMVGIERSILPLVGERNFDLASSVAVLSFIAAFGAAKAFTNLFAGGLAQKAGRRKLLIAGWAVALPVPALIAIAPSWGVIVAANLLLGVSQGLAWSMTVNMKIDLVGPRRRGLALGLNESAGYVGVALAAAITGFLASEFAARDVLVVAGFAIAVPALLASILLVRDTSAHVELEHQQEQLDDSDRHSSLASAFRLGTIQDRWLRSCSQAGLVNNLNDGLAWGLVPLYLAAHGASVSQIGFVAGLYPFVWGVGAAWRRCAGRPRQPQAADRGGNAAIQAGAPRCARCGRWSLCGSRGGSCAPWSRNGACVSDADGCGIGSHHPIRASACAGGLPILARRRATSPAALVAGVAARRTRIPARDCDRGRLTAGSSLWALIDMPARARQDEQTTISRKTGSERRNLGGRDRSIAEHAGSGGSRQEHVQGGRGGA